MNTSKYAHVETYIYSTSKGTKKRLEMILFCKGLLIPENFGILNSSEYFEKLESLKQGDSMTVVISAEKTSEFSPPPPKKILRRSVINHEQVRAGDIIYCKENTLHYFAKVTRIESIWAEIVFFPSWISGKEIQIDTVVKNIRFLTPDEATNPPPAKRYWKPA